MKPELSVILHSYIPYDVLSAVLSGSHYIIRDNYSCDGDYMNHWIYCHRGHYDGHLIQGKLDLPKVIGCDNQDTHMHIPVRFNSLPRVANKTLVGFQMGASEALRCWPKERFLSLARKLLSADDRYHVVLIGSAKKKDFERQFLAALSPEERTTGYLPYRQNYIAPAAWHYPTVGCTLPATPGNCILLLPYRRLRSAYFIQPIRSIPGLIKILNCTGSSTLILMITKRR